MCLKSTTKFRKWIYIFYYFYFFFTVQLLPLSQYPLPQFLIPFLLLPVSKRMSPLLTKPPHSLGTQVCWGLVALSHTEARPSNPLLYMCWEPLTSSFMLSGWCLSVWEISWVQVSWNCWSSYMVALLLRSFQPFPNSTTGITDFSPVIGCEYLHLPESAPSFAYNILIGITSFGMTYLISEYNYIHDSDYSLFYFMNFKITQVK